MKPPTQEIGCDLNRLGFLKWRYQRGVIIATTTSIVLAGSQAYEDP